MLQRLGPAPLRGSQDACAAHPGLLCAPGLESTTGCRAGATSISSSPDLEVLRSFQNQIAAIQRDAVWWLHTVVPAISKLAPKDYVHWYDRLCPAPGRPCSQLMVTSPGERSLAGASLSETEGPVGSSQYLVVSELPAGPQEGGVLSFWGGERPVGRGPSPASLPRPHCSTASVLV